MISARAAIAMTALNGTPSLFTLARWLRAGHAAVAREREAHPGGAGETGEATEQLPDRADQEDRLEAGGIKCTREDREYRADAEAVLRVRDVCRVLNGEGDRQQHQPADDRRVEDRRPDATGGVARGAVRLLGEVSRGIEPGDRVLGQQEPDREQVDPEEQPAARPVVEAAVVDPLAEDEAKALVLIGDDYEERDDHRDADHVPPDRDVVDHRKQVGAEDVDDRGGDQDDRRRAGSSRRGCARYRRS